MDKILPWLLVIILALLLFISFFFKFQSKEDIIKEKEQEIQKQELKIDSLTKQIAQGKERVIEYKDSIRVITVYVEKEKEKVKTIPLDSNTLELKHNLVAFGELTKETDTLPKMISDSTVLLSEENVIDMNCIVLDYEKAMSENGVYTAILEEDSIIITKQDSIILCKDLIISKQDSIFAVNQKRLEKDIKSAKWKSGGIGFVSGVVVAGAIISGVILGVSGGK